MKTHLIAIFCLVSISLMGQKTYAPAWESLDTRPVPSWFENAKFGIFYPLGLVFGTNVVAQGHLFGMV